MYNLLRNWKTTGFGLATLAVYVCKYIWPEHAAFLDGLIPILIGSGLLVAKDQNVSGTGTEA